MPHPERSSLLLANARLFDPASGRDESGAMLIENGIIRELGSEIDAASVPGGTHIVDCRGLVLTAGLVDMRAFCGEPGAEYRETLKTASAAAAAGGVTTIVCSPNTSPPVDDPAIVDFLQRRARDAAVVRIEPAAALTKGLEGREMTEIGLLQEAGAVAFSDGPVSVRNAQVMRRLMVYSRL